jgi:hypothetical protein
MLLNNQFQFFNKKGDNINPDYRPNLVVTVIDPSGEGKNADIRAYTDYYGRIVHVQIVNPGFDYGSGTYLRFTDLLLKNNFWDSEPGLLTIGTNGELTSFAVPTVNDNNDFPYTSFYNFSNDFLPNVSTGLIESENIFIIEKVLDSNGDVQYTYPRVDEYGPFPYTYYESNGKTASITIQTIDITSGRIDAGYEDTIYVSPAFVTDIKIGMNVSGLGIPEETSVLDVDYATGKISLTAFSTISGNNLVFKFWNSHYLKVGSKLSFHTGLFAGFHTVTDVSTFTISFESAIEDYPVNPPIDYYYVVPQFEARLANSSDPEWFLYNVTYNVNYPTISKFNSYKFEFTNPWETGNIDTFSGGNGELIRTVYGYIHKKPFQLNVGIKAEVEGVYVGVVEIADVTFTYSNQIIYSSLIECEVEGEDERLGLLLENFGRDVTPEQELMLRDSDVNESNTNFILLNQKRKEMLLQGDQIWPYVGSYRGLVNIINWFGYYDVRIKEYFLNINTEDVYYNKYRQVQIPFQLYEKGIQPEVINLVPSKYYKKTSLFGLFYDIVRDSGDFDEFGVPITEDAFAYTNEEVLIKLFALKAYLKQKFLPLNARIVDITGEGVYYERYAVNSWNDRNDRIEVNAGRTVNFTNDKRAKLIDLRTYDFLGGLLTPEITDNLSFYTNKYNINDVIIITGGIYPGEIPKVVFPGSAVQQARGECRVRAYFGAVTPSTVEGINYQVGDIITLSGGVYENPIRLEVTSVNISGGIISFNINSGPLQGSNYTNLPIRFAQATVLRSDGSQYYIPHDATGFIVNSSELNYTIQEVTLYDLGRSYNTIPTISFYTDNFTPILDATANLDIKIEQSAPVSYYNDTEFVKKYSDSPFITVGAPIDLSTSFDVTWDQLTYVWETFTGASDATLKAWTLTSPAYGGTLEAVEIISQGSDYTYAPTFKVTGGGPGFGATVTGQLRGGKLNILTYDVVSVSTSLTPGASGDILQLSPSLPPGGLFAVSTGRIVKGLGIPDGVIIDTIVGNDIYLKGYDGSAVVTTAIMPTVNIHQGVSVTTVGSGYTSNPTVSPNGGHTKTLYTWNELGRGNFYQMEWKAILSEPTEPGRVYEYKSGIGTIDDLINHTMILPYTGKYNIVMDVYDTNNVISNAIKKNAVEVYMPEADFAFVSRNIEGCKDTWDEFKQIIPVDTAQQLNLPVPSIPPDAPDPIEYNWDNAVGRWVNITFNRTLWDDADLNWNDLIVTNLSDINQPTFPNCKDIEILQVSAEDIYEGPIVDYKDPNTYFPAPNPTITVAGQNLCPPIDPAYDPTDWIYIRRDNVIYQLEVLGADYSVPGQTSIILVNTPPQAFRASPTTWEVLREIGGTIAVKGDLVYNDVTNPEGFKIGKYLVLNKEGTTPISKSNIISAKAIDSIDILNGANDSLLKKPGAYGKIYQIRDYINVNGNLNWNVTTASSSWVFVNTDPNDPAYSDHTGQILLNPLLITCNPLAEIRPGFTRITLHVYDGSSEIYKQTFRTKHCYLNTSTTGYVYNVWNSSAYVIDVVGMDGGNMAELNSKLTQYVSLYGSPSIYLDYQYNEFTTRERFAINNSSDETIYMHFDQFPQSGEFTASTNFGPSYNTNHTNWFYDHGIVMNDYSLQITNTGVWKGGVGTLVSLLDDQSELFRTDTFYLACQQEFDEDYAKSHLGTRVQTWYNYEEITWDLFCGNSWNTLDFTDNLVCGYVIDAVDTNGGIKFNEFPVFSFQGIVGGMSVPQKFSQALWELNNSDNPGIGKFTYSINNTLNNNTYTQLITQKNSKLDTYNYPNAVIFNNNVLSYISPGNVLYEDIYNPATTITSSAPHPTLLNYTIAYTDKPIPKKAKFVANSVAGSRVIKNILGLHPGQVRVGEVISGDYLNVSPATPAKVLQIVVEDEMVRQLILDSPLSATGTYNDYNVEWSTPSNTEITTPIMLSTMTQADLQIIGTASNPSNDNLGYLVGLNGVIFLPPQTAGTAINTTISHTFPLGNFYSWFGYGKNKVGAFEYGLDKFLEKYRYAQVYTKLGTSPFGEPGWYPADELPYAYSYSNSTAFSNYLDAKAQSERLPYENSMNGSYTWEETQMGKYNAKLPAGSAVLLSAEASDIAGKSGFLWKIKDGDVILAETIDSRILWTFDYIGNFDVELIITDTNGNKKTKNKKSFINIYENAQ